MTRAGSKTATWTRLTRRKAAPPSNYGGGWGGGPFWADAFRSRRAPTPWDLIEAFKSLTYACCKLNANAVARTPLRLYATTKGGQPRPKSWLGPQPIGQTHRQAAKALGRFSALGYTRKALAGAEEVEEITDHPLLDAVLKVNEDLDHTQLLIYTAMSLDIVGSAYWWPDLSGAYRVPGEIWALPPHLVMPVWTSGSMVPDAYTFGGITYPKGDLIRFRHLSARNPYGEGYSPLRASIEYARLEDTFVSIQDDMLSNGPRPSLIISHKDPKGTFGTAERTRLEHDMNRKERGGRSGSVAVVDGAAAVTPVSYTPADLGGLQISGYDLERIANCFDVPVSMLKTEDVNRANAEAGERQHGRNAVEPRCKTIASTLTRWTHAQDPGGRKGWDRLFWAFDPVVAEDQQAEAELHKTYFAMGLPPNVILTEAGYDSIEGGDVPLMPAGLQTLDSVIHPPAPTPPGKAPGQGDDEPATEDGETPPEDESDDETGAEATPAEPEPLVTSYDEAAGKSFAVADSPILSGLAESIRSKVARLAEAGFLWDPVLKRAAPCHDERGHFTSCHNPGAIPSGTSRKPPKAPRAPKVPKPAAPPKEPKPKPAPKPAKEPRKPAAPKPPKEPRVKPEKPAKEPRVPAARPSAPKESATATPSPTPTPTATHAAAGTNFGASKAKLVRDKESTPEQHAALVAKAKTVLGPHATDADIGSITGAPDNAKVTLKENTEYGADKSKSVVVQVTAPGFYCSRTIKRGDDGKLSIKNNFIEVKEKGTGLGSKVFGRQVENAVRLGATKIECVAARNENMNGYVTWPKLGYDGPISDRVRESLPRALKKAKNVSDLMKTPEGRAFWEAKGASTDMAFDLKAGSQSRKVLAEYLQKKGIGQ